MKARLPDSYNKGVGNMQAMVKQAQKMQEDITALQEELNNTEYKTSVGGGAVEITVNGKKELISLSIKPEVVDPEDVEMLQDLIISAVNEGIRKAEADSEEKMSAVTGNVPGMGGLGGLF